MTDPVQSKRFAKAELWSEWARRHDRHRTDVGIDLVCTRHDGGLAAVQCKLLAPERRILKADIDSFISASAIDEFAERLIVETTESPWSENARAMVLDQSIPSTIIGLQDLRYPLDLLRRVITVSLETTKIVCALPELAIE